MVRLVVNPNINVTVTDGSVDEDGKPLTKPLILEWILNSTVENSLRT